MVKSIEEKVEEYYKKAETCRKRNRELSSRFLLFWNYRKKDVQYLTNNESPYHLEH